MHADIQGALNQINKSYRAFEHRGKSMTKDEVKKVLKFGLECGYKTTNEFSDEDVDEILRVPQYETPKVITNEKAKEVFTCASAPLDTCLKYHYCDGCPASDNV